jgi:hypothetical protein
MKNKVRHIGCRLRSIAIVSFKVVDLARSATILLGMPSRIMHEIKPTSLSFDATVAIPYATDANRMSPTQLLIAT